MMQQPGLENLTSIGDLPAFEAGEGWVLIFGGVSRAGNRRARRFADGALRRGLAAVWFDGFEETYPDDPERRVPLDTDVTSGRVHVVRYAAAERNLLANRVARAAPKALRDITSFPQRKSQSRATDALAYAGRQGARQLSKVSTKLASFARPFAAWRIAHDQVWALGEVESPTAILSCDDHAITMAWHAARRWPDAALSLERLDS